jgi:CDP-diacylglycerol--serine O-phosphatidyltransferase
VARFTHTTSRFGVEYDSLADLIAFGVAPGLLVYNWALLPYDNWGWSAAFLFVICGALRLARYNVQIDTIESVTFNGLPIPAAAGMVVTTVLLSHHLGYAGPVQHVSIPIMVFLLALLMVSNVKFVSFKEMQLRRRKPFTLFLALIVLLVLVANEPAIVLFILSAVYVLHGPVRGLILWRKKSHSPDTAAAQAQDQENPAQGTTQRETNPLPSEEDDDGDSPLP